jgi:FkbM family methyltransferase
MNNNIKSLGTEYGKHYVDTNLLNKDSVIYSFGIGEDISFDLELIKKLNCIVYGFDPTPKATNFINENKFNNFLFFNYGLSNFDGVTNFTPPSNPEHASYKESKDGAFKFPVKKLSTIMKELKHENIDLLKLDIEGSEFTVIENILEENIYPKQMSIEFHGKKEEILSWINSNKKLKELYTGEAHPCLGNQVETHFLRK